VKRKLAYRYLMIWPVLAVLFTWLTDLESQRFRTGRLMEFSRSYQLDMLRLAYGVVKEAGPAALHTNESVAFDTLDVYIADRDQQAVTKPRFSQIDTTITNKSIIRALELEPGKIDTWISPSDYRGVPVIAVYTSIDIEGERYALICEIDQDEVFSKIENYWFYVDVVWIAIFAGIGGLCIYHLRDDIVKIVRPAQERNESGHALVTKARTLRI